MLRGRGPLWRNSGSFWRGLLLSLPLAAFFAALSASLLLCIPSWPGTHLIVTSRSGCSCAIPCIIFLKLSAKYEPGHDTMLSPDLIATWLLIRMDVGNMGSSSVAIRWAARMRPISSASKTVWCLSVLR